MKPSTYVYLARIAYMQSMHEKKIYKGKLMKQESIRFLINLFIS